MTDFQQVLAVSVKVKRIEIEEILTLKTYSLPLQIGSTSA